MIRAFGNVPGCPQKSVTSDCGTVALSRRRLLGGVAAGVAGGAVINAVALVEKSSAVQPVVAAGDRVLQAVTECLKAMTELHGGKWRAHIDLETGFILIKPSKAGGVA